MEFCWSVIGDDGVFGTDPGENLNMNGLVFRMCVGDY